MGIIYLATINDKLYVGKTIKTLDIRISQHLCNAKQGSSFYFHKAIRKYGADKSNWCILEELPDDELAEAEKFWIAYYRYIGAELYNLTDGGEGQGRFVDKETKIRISQATKEAMLDPEIRNKIAQSKLKYQWTIRTPEQSIVVTDNLRSFCRKHNLNRQNLLNTLTGFKNIKQHKGYTLLERQNLKGS